MPVYALKRAIPENRGCAVFRADYSFDTQYLDLTDKRVIDSPKLMQRTLKRQQPRVRKRILKIVAVEPGAPVYPIIWTSDKQRRAFFATNGFGRGIPTVRTHAIRDSWDARFEFQEDGGDFIVENKAPYAHWVVGLGQQGFHATTGWIYAQRTIDQKVVPIVLDVYEKTWLSVSDPFVKAS